MELKFKQINDQEIEIYDGDKKVGQIFTPASSGRDTINSIQICGFSEAYDYWGCGVFRGYKDIQLMFGDKPMGGEHNSAFCETEGCICCYRKPCQCETDVDDNSTNPFKLKRSHQLQEKLLTKRKTKLDD